MKPGNQVAIIGGGVSGLSLAHYLHKKGIDYVLFEKEKQLGGNACTRKTIHNGREKYVDMAVNDFNPTQYQRLRQLMSASGAKTGQVDADTTFFSGSGALFRESELKDSPLAPEIERFKKEAMEVTLLDKYRSYSVREYFSEKGYSRAFLHQYLYPRVQGLFFYPDGGIEELPVRFVMNFYGLQGGYKFGGSPASTRFNFKNGAGAWIADLVRMLPAEKISVGAIPTISKTDRGYCVDNNRIRVMVDQVVFACHADDLCRAYGDILSPVQHEVLSKVKYARMTSVAHCDRSYLPLAETEYSAYNCFVKTPGSKDENYTITYNCNKHQNLDDTGNTSDGEDLFFVTVNPVRPIEDQFILRDRNGNKLVKEFSRNICDFGLLEAQRVLPALQGIGNLYFTGGYTNGIGLHENCLRQSVEVAALLARQKARQASAAANQPEWNNSAAA